MTRPVHVYLISLSLTLTIFLLFAYSASQAQLPCKTISEAMYTGQLEQLKTEFGKNKSLQEDFELALLISLSKYPELKELRIEVVYGKIKTTCQPKPREIVSLSFSFSNFSRNRFETE